MTEQQLNDIRERMLLAVKHSYNLYRDTGKRCPNIKQMAEYINARLLHLEAEVIGWSERKGYQASSGLWYSYHTYKGYRLEVTDRKSHERIFEHITTETYRMNYEMAEFILKEEKKLKG